MPDSNPSAHIHPLPRLTKQLAQSLFRRPKWPAPLRAERTHLYFRGSNAIWHALKTLRLEAGDEVLFPAYHCGIELDVLLAAGLRVTFYPVGRDLALDASVLARHMGPTTRAVYVIHYYGLPQDLNATLEVCRRRGVAMIEDCAMALYGRLGDRPLGSYGDVSIFSLWKTVAMPFGGALVVNNPRLPRPEAAQPPSRYEVLRAVKQLLEMEFKGRRWFERIRRWCAEPFARAVRGVSVRTSEDGWRRQPLWVPLFAAGRSGWGMTALSRHLFLTADGEAIYNSRRANYSLLAQALQPLSCVAPLCGELPDGACPLYCPVLVEDPVAFRQFLLGRGVEAFLMWRETHPLFPKGEFPDAAYLRAHVVALPVHQHLDAEMRSAMAEALAAWDRRHCAEHRAVSHRAAATEYAQA